MCIFRGLSTNNLICYFHVAGWGTLENGNIDKPAILQEVSLPIVSTDACIAAYGDRVSFSFLFINLSYDVVFKKLLVMMGGGGAESVPPPYFYC